MPLQTIVVIEDADGDEFPVAFAGDLRGHQPTEIFNAAEARLKPMMDAGELRPTLPIRLGPVEYPSL